MTTLTKTQDNVEETLTAIAELTDRQELIRRIRNFSGRFKLDFTPDFLNEQSTEGLRHILFAAVTHCKK